MSKNFLTTSLLVLSAFGLSGCAEWERHMQSRLPEPTPVYADKQINVAPTRSVHAVAFSTSSAMLTADEQAYLKNFLNNAVFETGVVVMVEKAPARNRVASLRQQALTGWLKAHGYPTAPVALPDYRDESLRVAVDHLVALAPKCPNWDFHKYDSFGSQPSPNFGCSDRTNLSAMVANPRDLVAGQVAPAPVGNAVLHGELRYRTDSIGPLSETDNVSEN